MLGPTLWRAPPYLTLAGWRSCCNASGIVLKIETEPLLRLLPKWCTNQDSEVGFKKKKGTCERLWSQTFQKSAPVAEDTLLYFPRLPAAISALGLARSKDNSGLQILHLPRLAQKAAANYFKIWSKKLRPATLCVLLLQCLRLVVYCLIQQNLLGCQIWRNSFINCSELSLWRYCMQLREVNLEKKDIEVLKK